MRALVLIPARAGSVGIPGKNLHPVGGRPLIAWTITQALESPSVERVVVSTDDDAIAEVARDWGAEVIVRPAELASAEASSESALLHALETLRADEGYEPDLVAFLQCTSPIRRPDDIEAAIRTCVTERADSLFSAGPSHGFIWRVEPDGARPLNYDPSRRPRRQDAPEDVVENGSIYVFRPEVLRQTGHRLGGKIAVYRMGARESFQVDEPQDLVVIEALFGSGARDRSSQLELARVELLLLDFDGVLTDNRVLVDQSGVESVRCHRGDGWGIARLREAGVSLEVISTETNPVVAARCAKLGIPARRGVLDKEEAVHEAARAHGLDVAQVAFVGNDVNDLPALRAVGLPIAVADATLQVRRVCRWVTSARGGEGAVREVADALLAARRLGEEVRRVA